MPVAVKDSAQASATNSSATIVATVPASGYAIGDLVIGFVFCASTSRTLNSITDTGGNSWTIRGPYDQASSLRLWVFESLLTVALASGDSITATLDAANTRRGIQIVGASGLIAAPHDQVGGAATGSSTAPDSGDTGTLAQAIEFAFGVIGWRDAAQHTGDMTWEGSWTNIGEVESGSATSWRYAQGGYKITAATTAIKASGTFGSGTNWLAVVHTYQASPAEAVVLDPAVGSADAPALTVTGDFTTIVLDPAVGSAGAPALATTEPLAVLVGPALGASAAPGLVLIAGAIGGLPPPDLVSMAAVAARTRPLLADYELWASDRSRRLAIVSGWEVLEARPKLSDAALGAEKLSLVGHRESLFVGETRQRLLSELARILTAEESPVLVRRSAEIGDTAWRLEAAADVPYAGYDRLAGMGSPGDVLHQTSWRGLFLETQDEPLTADVNLPLSLVRSILVAICGYSQIAVPGAVEPSLNVVLDQFTALKGVSVWKALLALGQAANAEIVPSLELGASQRWTGRIVVDLSPPPTRSEFVVAARFNLLAGAQRELNVARQFSRVIPQVAGGRGVESARFMLSAVDSGTQEITLSPGVRIGPTDDTWAGKYAAIFADGRPGESPSAISLIVSDSWDGQRTTLELASWHASILPGHFMGLFEDVAHTQPIGYVRHPQLEIALGRKEKLETYGDLQPEVVENAQPALGESYDGGGVPVGSPIAVYSKIGTATSSKNTVPERDLDGDGQLEPLMIFGGGSWRLQTSALNAGQQLTVTLDPTLEFLKQDLKVRILLGVAQGQVHANLADTGDRSYTLAAYPTLFDNGPLTPVVGSKGYFANLGNLEQVFEQIQVRIKFVTKAVGGGPFSLSLDFKVGLVDQLGVLIANLATVRTAGFTADGTAHTYTHTTGLLTSLTHLPNRYSIVVTADLMHNYPSGTSLPPGFTNSTFLSSLAIDMVRFVHTSNRLDIVTRVGHRGLIEMRFGDFRPIGNITLQIYNAQAQAADWYTQLIQVKRGAGLGDERDPLRESGYSAAFQRAVKFWTPETSERFGFVLPAYDPYYQAPEQYSAPMRVGRLARTVIPDLQLDDLRRVVSMEIDDTSRGSVRVALSREPGRLTRQIAEQTSELAEAQQPLETLYSRARIAIMTNEE